jgi:uncharacterized protein YkwD
MPRKMIALVLFLAFRILPSQQVEDLGLSLEQLEDKLLILVNHERSGRGLPELQFDPLLRTMARAHSQKMIQENQLAHDFPGYEKLADRAVQAGLHFSDIGENVAKGDTFIMRFFHEQLMSSPGHRENILSDHFRQLGIGIGLSGNVYYITQEFANLFEPLSQLEVEREMEKKLNVLFGSKIVLSKRTAAEIQEFCRDMSSLFLQDQSPKNIPDSFGAVSILNIKFIEMEIGLNRIIAATKGTKLLYWSLGVTFGCSDKNPGGAYALSLILFPDLRDALDTNDGLNTVILQAINNIRKSNNLVSMTMMPILAKPAADMARFFYRFPNNQIIKYNYRSKLLLTYQTSSLNVIPADIAQKIAASSHIYSLGINVFYPLAEELLGNYFIVAISGI